MEKHMMHKDEAREHTITKVSENVILFLNKNLYYMWNPSTHNDVCNNSDIIYHAVTRIQEKLETFGWTVVMNHNDLGSLTSIRID